MVKILTVQWKA